MFNLSNYPKTFSCYKIMEDYFMKRSYLLLISLLIVGICIPAVSAECYTFNLSEDSIYESSGSHTGDYDARYVRTLDTLRIINSQLLYGKNIINAFTQIRAENLNNYDALPSSDSTRVTIGDWARATYGYFKYTSAGARSLQIYVSNFEVLDDYPIGLSGERGFVLTPDDDDFVFPTTKILYGGYSKDYALGIAIGASVTPDSYPMGKYYYKFSSKWKNDLTIDTQPANDIITLNRYGLSSQIDILTFTDNYKDTANEDYQVILVPSIHRPYSVIVTNPISGNTYIYNITSEGILQDDQTAPYESGITVYIKNSQTGALIANANVALDAVVDGEYYPVTNRTEPSGIFTITLQPTGGGKPNPDGYRLIVNADGYNNPIPEINFTLGEYIKYFECFLDPIAGGPADQTKTFIDFFVRDMSSNPISGATVKFGKYTLITNSAGYTVFEVDKNNTYSWTVSKSGYGTLTGNAVIGNDPRHTINTVLAPIVTPTTTTPIPTSSPIGPTPTMTAPTGEPVSNWLEWFAAHFGMILGGGVEIGKIFMWLCFTVPVGVYVGKESKAGAAGFMAGAGIVTLFFVLIGWVPIWLVVLLALIVGLLYAKVFNAPDNGGGR